MRRCFRRDAIDREASSTTSDYACTRHSSGRSPAVDMCWSATIEALLRLAAHRALWIRLASCAHDSTRFYESLIQFVCQADAGPQAYSVLQNLPENRCVIACGHCVCPRQNILNSTMHRMHCHRPCSSKLNFLQPT